MAATTPAYRPHRPVRTAHSRPWVAVTASFAAMVLVFVVLMVLELTQSATSTAPLVVVAGPGAHTSAQVTLTKDQFAISPSHAVTVRLRNDSDTPARVTVTVGSTSQDYSGTLTAALTSDGASSRSGALGGLNLPDLTVAGTSTSPVTLELAVTDDQLNQLWSTAGDMTVTVTRTS